MAIDHYENFPVASLLLPSRLRKPVQTLYHFARSADDIADEGDMTPQERLSALAYYGAELDRIEKNEMPESRLFIRLADVIRNFHLPLEPFKNLLFAFRQDISISQYESYTDLLEYCRHSANPVGLLMLHLYDAVNENNCHMSDAICTALQLTNFWQDIAIDWEKGRLYLPLEDMRRFGVLPKDISSKKINDNWRSLLKFEVERTRELMYCGSQLPAKLPGRIGWELKLVMEGGLRILEMIESADFDIFDKRPRLRRRDWFAILWRSLAYRTP